MQETLNHNLINGKVSENGYMVLWKEAPTAAMRARSQEASTATMRLTVHILPMRVQVMMQLCKPSFYDKSSLIHCRYIP